MDPRVRRALWAVGFCVVCTVLVLTGVLRFGAPVSVASRSMSHADHAMEGVLDPGERIILAPVRSRHDVVTLVEGLRTGHVFAGDHGDAIAFQAVGPDVSDRIVHRALVWVEYNASADAYDVPDLGLSAVRTFTIPHVGTYHAWNATYAHGPETVALEPGLHGRHDGFVTKGDHNQGIDQVEFPMELARVSHVHGRVERFAEGDRQMLTFGLAVALATVIAALVYLGRTRRAKVAALLGRAGRCACGARRAGAGFCPACGRQSG